jgi:two-component system, chemotaxis family, protein-glutamate methylesterase/glutaminase
MGTPVRVLIVDDSATVRRVLRETIARDPALEVVGVAPDPYLARELIVSLKPDVMTLDLEMPRMDGLSFLAKLMQHYPLPVVVISSAIPKGSAQAMRALELGAVEVLAKPDSAQGVAELGPMLRRTLCAAAQVRLGARPPAPTALAPRSKSEPGSRRGSARILAIGASTGGTEAIQRILAALPAETPGTIIVQHMPAAFTAAFARRLDESCAMTVAEARGGEDLRDGLAFVAPGGYHVAVVGGSGNYRLELRDGPLVHFQKPAVDVTFRSVAQAAGRQAVGILLTGMGVDGAAGLLALRHAGAHTIVQDEATSAVWGMPGAAFALGAAAEVLPLEAIACRLSRH